MAAFQPTILKRMEILKSDIAEIGKAKSFLILFNGKELPAFVLNSKSGYVSYLNSCPHAFAPLDYDDDDFYYEPIDRIVCKVHGATFQTESGNCDSGPCAGQGLTKLKVEEKEGSVLISAP